MSAVVDKIRTSLSWRSLNGRKAEHIVLKRERAVELLALFADMQNEIDMLRKRLGPRGLQVIEIDGAGHYVNAKVRGEIERLRALVEK